MKEYFLKVWGGAMPYLEKNLGVNTMYHYFKSNEEREAFLNKINEYSEYGLSVDTEEGIMTHLRTVADVVLRCGDEMYRFDFDFGYEFPEDVAIFMLLESDYACDCNRSLFIIEYCDEDFKKTPCGDNIKLIDINIKYLK